MKYQVLLRTYEDSDFEVEADSEEQAIEKAKAEAANWGCDANVEIYDVVILEEEDPTQ